MTEENYYEKILEVLDRYTSREPNFESKFARSILASEIAKTLTKDKEIVA
tara:strand:- start:1262 stop:1411 length:150 start_codon:yes stop_codon:yes gene_type:complete